MAENTAYSSGKCGKKREIDLFLCNITIYGASILQKFVWNDV